MATAKLNVQHDYLTVRVTFAKGARLNLTISYSGSKCTATPEAASGPQMQAVFKAFNLLHKRATSHYGNNGGFMEAVRKMAEQSSNVDELIAALNKALEETSTPKAEAPAAPPPLKVVPIEEVLKEAKGKKASYSQEELQTAFNRVRNSKDWKVRIDRTIPKADLDVTLAAIIHFHGAVPYTVPHKDPSKVIVRSKGYACH